METKELKKCESCEGTGKEKYSCCGDEMEVSLTEDVGLCPTCKEHTGGECDVCHGSGIAPTQFKVSLRVSDDESFDTKITATAKTPEEAEKAIRDYYKRIKLRIEEIYSIEKL